jgi:VPDSG-CTERM motif
LLSDLSSIEPGKKVFMKLLNLTLVLTAAMAASIQCATAQALNINIKGADGTFLHINSTVTQVALDVFAYNYQVTTLPDTKEDFYTLSVYFNTDLDIISNYEPAGSRFVVSPTNVKWELGVNQIGTGKSYDFGFYTDVPETKGSASGTGATTWPKTFGVYVPDTAVPDGGLTAALLGSGLAGLQALRRKWFI